MEETMSEVAVLDQKIGSAFQLCIEKIADRLLDKFDADDNESLSLFRLFCSAVRAHSQWLKKFFYDASPPRIPAAQPRSVSSQKKSNGQKDLAGKTDDAPIDAALNDLGLNSKRSQSPLRPQDLNNGLVYHS